MARSIEQRLVKAMVGADRPSVLDTDAYKLAMAQAGAPLRPETFYLTFRRMTQGPWYNPFDLDEFFRLLRPELPGLKQRGFLQTWGYGLTPAMEKAVLAEIETCCIPKGAWFGPKEPLAAVRSASFLVSGMEALGLMLQYPIQIATFARNGATRFDVTCEDEAEIVRIAWEAAGVEGVPIINVREREYRERVRLNGWAVRKALRDEPERAFEVGMRAATCIQQHRIALTELREIGIMRTSMLRLAYELTMIPVGTTGHEHQQRYGEDAAGFRAIRDTRPETPSYLFDTVEPELLGIPAIFEVVREWLDHRFSVRFDSGDQDSQFRKLFAVLSAIAPQAAYIFEDGYTAEKTVENEKFLAQFNLPRSQAWYGYGGFFISHPAFSEFTRDRVSAAWKLCETSGSAVMKWSGTQGKESTPGRPCSFVLVGEPAIEGLVAFDRLIGQQDEEPPEGFIRLTEADPVEHPGCYQDCDRIGNSPATAKLIKIAREERQERIEAAMEAAA